MEETERKVRPQRVSIPVGDNITLEALVCVAEKGTPESKVGIVLTHPHPMLGGSMYNNVVGSLLKWFGKVGYNSICFNFRGTGKSTGKGTWRGGGEREDVIGVCNYLVKEYSVEEIYLVGYSYGSAISLSVLNEVDVVRGAIAISYPFGVLTFILLGHLLEKAKTEKPIFFIIGSQDNFTGTSKFLQRVKELCLCGAEEYTTKEEEEEEEAEEGEKEKGNKDSEEGKVKAVKQVYKIIEDADHFWWGEEELLEEYLSSWIATIRKNRL